MVCLRNVGNIRSERMVNSLIIERSSCGLNEVKMSKRNFLNSLSTWKEWLRVCVGRKWMVTGRGKNVNMVKP